MLSFFKDAGVVLTLDAGRIRVEGLQQLPPQKADEIRKKIKQQRAEIINELYNVPPPEPNGLGQEDASFWKQALIQADHFDNPDTTPYDLRESQLSEQMQISDCIAATGNTEGIALDSAGPQSKKTDNNTGTLIKYESDNITQENCPARCKRTGKCYGTAWFNAKPGPARPCTSEQCPWADKFMKRGRDWR